MLDERQEVNDRRTVGGVCVLSRLQPQEVFALHSRDYRYSGYFQIPGMQDDDLALFLEDYPPQLHDKVICCSVCGSRRHIMDWLHVVILG